MSTILSVRLAQLEASAQVTGLITTAYFLGQVAGSRLGHRLMARSGQIRGFSAMAAVASMSILLVPLVPDPLAWIVLRFIAGVALVLAFLVMESWLNMSADNTTRGSVFGAYMVVVYLGMTGGQGLLGVLDIASFEAFSIAGMLAMAAILPLALTQRAQPELPPPVRLRLIDLVRISPVGIAAAVASGALTGAMFGLFPFFAADAGLQGGQIATFMAAVVGGGLVLNWPLGRLSDVFDRRLIIGVAAIAIASASAVIALVDRSLTTLVLAGGVLGGATA
ncbi:MAG TPA: MFS transporter, partial [Alphaproteobacteria bacterium]|nr:MFS transporter [Alphaproteobacteria bacterium]